MIIVSISLKGVSEVSRSGILDTFPLDEAAGLSLWGLKKESVFLRKGLSQLKRRGVALRSPSSSRLQGSL